MFNEHRMSDLEIKRAQEELEQKIVLDKHLRDNVAQKPEFVAEELFRKYKWASEKAEQMRVKMSRVREESQTPELQSELRDMYERWMLRYMTIEVQALSGLAAVSPEIRQKLSK